MIFDERKAVSQSSHKLEGAIVDVFLAGIIGRAVTRASFLPSFERHHKPLWRIGSLDRTGGGLDGDLQFFCLDLMMEVKLH